MKDKDNLYKLIDESKTSRLVKQNEWDLCCQFMKGNQHIAYDKTTKKIRKIPAPLGRNQVTINMCLGIIRTVASKLAANYPAIAIKPASSSSEDIVKAGTSELAFRYYWDKAKMPRIIAEAVRWSTKIGTAAFHSYYDKAQKFPVTLPISPYDLFFEQGATKIRESSFIAVRSYVQRDELIKNYPDFESQLKTLPANNRDPKVLLGGEVSYDFQKDRLEVYDVYCSDKAYYMLCQNLILFESNWPTQTCPVQPFYHTPLDDDIYGIGILQNIVDIQALYNKARAQIIDNADLMANPKWVVSNQSGVIEGSIKNIPGEIIRFNAMGGPAPFQVGGLPIPGYVIDNIRLLQSEILDASQVHAGSLGKRAVGVDSGVAIQSLVAQDVSQLQLTQDEIEEAVTNTAMVVLELMANYLEDSIWVKMFDWDGGFIHREIKNTDLIKVPEVFIEAGTLFRSSIIDRDERVISWAKNGLMSPEEAKDALLTRTGGSQVMDRMRDINHAQELLQAAALGLDIEIFATDNTKIIEKVFGNFIKSDDYYKLDPLIQNKIRDIYVALAAFQLTRENIKSKVYPAEPELPTPALPPGLAAGPRPEPLGNQDAKALEAYQRNIPVAPDQSPAGGMQEIPDQGMKATKMGV